jgi:peptidoglycan LD-endopeptidase LytH
MGVRVLVVTAVGVGCGAVAAAGVLALQAADVGKDAAVRSGSSSSPAADRRTSRSSGEESSPPRTMPSSPPSSKRPGASGRRTQHVFPVAVCTVSYGSTHHDYPATDVFAARGCPFVSPVAGEVDEVNRVDRWSPATNHGSDRGGLFVSVVGLDGVRYYGAHLEAVLPRVRPGLPVSAGAPLGRVGDTGSAAGTGTHLHFGLSWPTPSGYWWIRRGTVPPARYLDAWREGHDLSPARAVREARVAYGDDGRCHAYC